MGAQRFDEQFRLGWQTYQSLGRRLGLELSQHSDVEVLVLWMVGGEGQERLHGLGVPAVGIAEQGLAACFRSRHPAGELVLYQPAEVGGRLGAAVRVAGGRRADDLPPRPRRGQQPLDHHGDVSRQRPGNDATDAIDVLKGVSIAVRWLTWCFAVVCVWA